MATMDPTSRDKALRRAFAQVRALIECLRKGANATSVTDTTQASFVFSIYPLGGWRLSSAEARQYTECLNSLVALHGRTPTERPLSRSAADRLLKEAILRTLRPRKLPSERKTFARRLDRELRRLRKEMLAPLEAWTLNVEVFGLDVAGLPFKFGGIDFVAGTPDNARDVAMAISDFIPQRRVASKRVKSEQRARTNLRAEVAQRFSGHAIATLSVDTIDGEAALHIGVDRLRRTIDVLNFFAPYFHARGIRPRAYISPEAERTNLSYIASQVSSGAYSLSGPFSTGPGTDPVKMIDLASEQAQRIGLTRANALLDNTAPTDLERRIINAICWAGRASVEYRPEQAFLLFMISLEALLTKPTARTGVTDRLRLRVTHLIGLKRDARRRVFELMGRLSEVRNKLVHVGDSSDLTDTDLDGVRLLTRHALTGVLTNARFNGMRTSADFDKWFDEQLIGDVPIPAETHEVSS